MGEHGRITVDPEEVDKMARKAWKAVYDGMGGDEIELVASFLAIYKEELLPTQPAPDLGNITAEDV